MGIVAAMTAGFFVFPIEKIGKRGIALYWLALLAAVQLLVVLALVDFIQTFRERPRVEVEFHRNRGVDK
jgi:hypothetical protein